MPARAKLHQMPAAPQILPALKWFKPFLPILSSGWDLPSALGTTTQIRGGQFFGQPWGRVAIPHPAALQAHAAEGASGPAEPWAGITQFSQTDLERQSITSARADPEILSLERFSRLGSFPDLWQKKQDLTELKITFFSRMYLIPLTLPCGKIPTSSPARAPQSVQICLNPKRSRSR